MANEFRHEDVGAQLSRAEWEGLTTHRFASQATGDIAYASSATQLSRLAVGTAGQPLTSSGTLPQWGGTVAMADDVAITFGGVTSLLWETADPNANALVFALPDGGATDVPVIVIGDQSVLNVDLGFFDGITEPSVAVVDGDLDSWVMFGFFADDIAAIRSNRGVRMMTNDDQDDYFLFEIESNVPTIYGIGAYLRIGDAATTSHSLNSYNDLMVSGKLEVGGLSYFDSQVSISTNTYPVLVVTSPTADANLRILGGTNNYQAQLELWADLGADNVDKFRIEGGNGGALRFQHFGTGAYLSVMTMTATGLTLGAAGTLQGLLSIGGVTSGTVSVAVAAAAGTWTMTLPTAVGGAGEQLTDAAGNGVTSWAAAASLREYKDNIVEANPREALDTILNTKAHHFNYKEGLGTQDPLTNYVGVMADEASWAMHYSGRIVNPVNTLGYMVLGFQAIDEKIETVNDKIERLESELVELKASI